MSILMRENWLLITMFIVSLFGSYESRGEKMDSDQNIESQTTTISEAKLSSLSNKKIFFGHQSVGFNIVDGMEEIINQNPQLSLSILKAGEPIEGHEAFFAHAQIGKNRKPLSKLDAFSKAINNGIGDKADIAFMKFCYVDITKKTDIDKLFQSYKNELFELQQRFPNTTFIHVTSPLKTVQTGIKATIKKILGKPAGGYESNIMRNKFNEMLRNEYDQKGIVFDLAKVEATRPDGSRQKFIYNDKEYDSLYPGYTDDGGHLNRYGQKIAAENLLRLLSEIE